MEVNGAEWTIGEQSQNRVCRITNPEVGKSGNLGDEFWGIVSEQLASDE